MYTLVIFVLYTFGSMTTSTSQQVVGFRTKAECEQAKQQFVTVDVSAESKAHFNTYCVEVSTKEIHNGK